MPGKQTLGLSVTISQADGSRESLFTYSLAQILLVKHGLGTN